MADGNGLGPSTKIRAPSIWSFSLGRYPSPAWFPRWRKSRPRVIRGPSPGVQGRTVLRPFLLGPQGWGASSGDAPLPERVDGLGEASIVRLSPRRSRFRFLRVGWWLVGRGGRFQSEVKSQTGRPAMVMYVGSTASFLPPRLSRKNPAPPSPHPLGSASAILAAPVFQADCPSHPSMFKSVLASVRNDANASLFFVAWPSRPWSRTRARCPCHPWRPSLSRRHSCQLTLISIGGCVALFQWGSTGFGGFWRVFGGVMKHPDL
jgi:hypothetical protein